MTDHANELRRYSRKIGHPAGDVPSVMLAAAEEIERLAARLEAAERERDECNRRRLEAADHFAAQTALMKKKYDDLRVKVAEMEQQEPVAWTVRGVAEWVSNGDGTYSLGGCLEAVAPLPDDTQLYALPGAQAQPAASVPSDEYVGWYCAHCERGVDASEVTYHEQHQACGRAITDDRPPRHSPSVPDSILADAARYRFLRNGGAYLEPNEGEIYMATDYGAKYYKDLRDLDMDIDEALAAAPEAKP